ncbi:hypothetical protein [Roseibium polysiphoniae]|uniref:hypothetical protein n=1 Tax=Roseibium polysiphoniae TaxID=2571221 RepID=UPI0032989C58
MFLIISATQQGRNRDSRQHYYRTVETDSPAAKQWLTDNNIIIRFKASKRPLLPCSNLSPFEINADIKFQQSKLPDQVDQLVENFRDTQAP